MTSYYKECEEGFTLLSSYGNVTNSYALDLYFENQSGETGVGVGCNSIRGKSDIPISDIIFSAAPAFNCIKSYLDIQLPLIYRTRRHRSFRCRLRLKVDLDVLTYIGASRPWCQMLIYQVPQVRMRQVQK